MGMIDTIFSAFSAIGTVGAVVVALRISRKGDKYRETQDRRLQRIHALRILPILEARSENLRILCTELFFDLDEISDENGYIKIIHDARAWANEYRSLPVNESLGAGSLLMLPEKVALRISYAMGVLESLSIDIPSFEPSKYPNIVGATEKVVGEWDYLFHSATDHFGAAVALLRDITNVNEFAPDAEELYRFHGF